MPSPTYTYRRAIKMPSHFTLTISRTLPFALICVAIAGCPPRKQITSNAPAFRLKSAYGHSLLLSPAIPADQSLNASIALKLGAASEVPVMSHACSISKGMFRLERDPDDSNFRIVLPPPDKWIGPSVFISDEPDLIDLLYSFLAAVDEAERARCFAPSSTPARDYIRQSVPIRLTDSIFNGYDYQIERIGGNLKPGLRLKLERAYFNGGDRSDKNYLGISTVFFEVTKDSGGLIRFQEAQPIQYSPAALAQTDQEGPRDIAVLDLPPQKNYRVLFYMHKVPTDRNFSAALIGSDDSTRLDSFEQSMRADTNPSCASSNHDDIKCFEFRGFVTITVQIPVQLNGKPEFVDWGTKVSGVVPRKVPKALSIQRRFGAASYDVIFKRGDNSILGLTLVNGDRLTW